MYAAVIQINTSYYPVYAEDGKSLKVWLSAEEAYDELRSKPRQGKLFIINLQEFE